MHAVRAMVRAATFCRSPSDREPTSMTAAARPGIWVKEHLRRVPLLRGAYSATRRTIWRVRDRALWLVGTREQQLASMDANDLRRTIRIDPRGITRTVGEMPAGRFAKDGDWDRQEVGPITEKKESTAVSTHMMFAQGLDHRTTPQYERMRSVVALHLEGRCDTPSTMGAYWCRTYDDIDAYFAALVRTFEDMRRNGYRTQEELRAARPDGATQLGDEIQILVDRDGQLVLGKGGAHRLLMAGILGIPDVPAEIVGAHTAWVRHQAYLGDARRTWQRGKVLRRLQAAIDGLSR